MKANYLLDIEPSSISLIHTPSTLSRQLPFFIYNLGYYHARPGYFTEREGQDNYLLFYTLHGSGLLRHQGNEYVLKPEQALILNCNDEHFYCTGPEGSWEFKWVHFSGSGCIPYFNLINEDSLNLITLSDTTRFEHEFDQLFPLAERSDVFSDVRCSMLLTSLLSEMVACKLSSLNNRRHSQHSAMIDRVVEYIQLHYEKPLGLPELIAVAHISKFHFLRLFKKYTGVSPYEYIINCRINHSKALLRNTEQPVGEIAFQVGFGNANNYIREFKKITGTTPLKYRNFWVT